MLLYDLMSFLWWQFFLVVYESSLFLVGEKHKHTFFLDIFQYFDYHFEWENNYKFTYSLIAPVFVTIFIQSKAESKAEEKS
jgi:hypothetical protein